MDITASIMDTVSLPKLTLIRIASNWGTTTTKSAATANIINHITVTYPMRCISLIISKYSLVNIVPCPLNQSQDIANTRPEQALQFLSIPKM
jgi:hypothetical protein